MFKDIYSFVIGIYFMTNIYSHSWNKWLKSQEDYNTHVTHQVGFVSLSLQSGILQTNWKTLPRNVNIVNQHKRSQNIALQLFMGFCKKNTLHDTIITQFFFKHFGYC